MSEVGSFLKRKREAKGYSLKKLALLCNISDSELYKIENGSRQNPNWKNLCEIAKSLDVHPFEVLLEAGCISEADISPAHIIKGLDVLSDEDIKLVQLFVDFIITQRNRNLKGAGESNDI